MCLSVLTYLSTEAVAHSADLLDTLLGLQPREGVLDDGVDVFLSVRVVSRATLGEPPREVEVSARVQGHGVAVDDVDYEGQVAVGGELVGDEFAVGPDAEDVRQVEDGGILVCLGRVRGREVASHLANLDVRAGWRSAVNGRNTLLVRYLCDKPVVSGPGREGCLRDNALGNSANAARPKERTYSCLTPTVQHCPGGLEAMVKDLV